MSKTNFFTEVSTLVASGSILTMTLTKLGDGKLAVSVLPKNKNVKDESVQSIAPLVVTALPEELDEQFLEAITKPIQKTTALISNLEKYEKSVEDAEKNSKIEKDKEKKEKEEKEKLKKEREANDKKATDLLAEVKKLEADSKADEAKAKLDGFLKKDLALSDSVTKKLTDCQEELKEKLAQSTLF